MRIVQFLLDGVRRIGVRDGDEVVDLSVAAPDLPQEMNAFLAAGPETLKAAAAAVAGAPDAARHPFSGLHFLPPSDRPSKIVCLGANYMAHAQEGAVHLGQIGADEEIAEPEFPAVFLRGPSSLTAHEQPLVRPHASTQLDFECELAFVIGRETRHATPDEALSCVAGYACFNDGSLRDFQLRTSQWALGKNFDETGAFGPELVTPDELPDGAAGLRIQTRLNGEVMQDANTGDMIFGVAQAVVILSECMTLYPGDVVIMGTCEGVGLTRKPPVYMAPGDVCEVEIEGIGILRNTIVAEGCKPGCTGGCAGQRAAQAIMGG
ncbi:fumarylacetoacetate hydrolase family protein [Actibacterium sp. D379-3]